MDWNPDLWAAGFFGVLLIAGLIQAGHEDKKRRQEYSRKKAGR